MVARACRCICFFFDGRWRCRRSNDLAIAVNGRATGLRVRATDGLVIGIHLSKEPLPLGPGVPIIEKVVRAVFVRLAQATARPVVVGNHFAQRNIVLLHQVGRQLGGALKGGRPAIALIFTHFNTDGVAVTRPTKISMLTLLVGGQVLHGTIFINAKVPDKIANAVKIRLLACTELAVL